MSNRKRSDTGIAVAALALLGSVLLAGGAFAQDAGGATFSALSPGNRIIAQALYDAQPQTGTVSSPWSLDRIAAAKADGKGWGEVFHQMKADGLISSRNLGQVVSSYQRANAAPPFAPPHNGALVITTGRNQTAAVADVTRGNAGAGHDLDRAAVKHDAEAEVGRDHAGVSGESFAGGPIVTAGGRGAGIGNNVANGHSNDNGTADPSFVGGPAVVTGAPSAGQGGGIGGGHGHGRGR